MQDIDCPDVQHMYLWCPPKIFPSVVERASKRNVGTYGEVIVSIIRDAYAGYRAELKKEHPSDVSSDEDVGSLCSFS
jgi:hypothetical protein